MNYIFVVVFGGILAGLAFGAIAMAGAMGFAHTQPKLLLLFSPYLYYYGATGGGSGFSWVIFGVTQYLYGVAIAGVIALFLRWRKRKNEI